MWVYIETCTNEEEHEPSPECTKQFTVGFFAAHSTDNGVAHKWYAERSFADQDQAAARVNYLNGGSVPESRPKRLGLLG